MSMTENHPAPRRNWRRIALVVVIVTLTIVLYPQLKDFGAEIVRAFN